MKRVLIAWEMGANFGHLARLVPLALQLREHGAQVLFVIRDISHARTLLTESGLDFISAPAPISSINPGPHFLPVSYADILALQGMSSNATLEPQVATWLTVFDLFKPDAVLLDHAPVAMFAAQLGALPRTAIGTGFELPPMTRLFPLFRRASQERRAELLQLESGMLRTLNQLVLRYRGSLFEKNADIFRGSTRCFVTMPQLDHYGRRLDTGYLGLLPTLRRKAMEEPLIWPKGGKRILVYLQPFYSPIKRLLRTLAQSGYSIIACLPGAKTDDYQEGNMCIRSRFIDTSALIPQADLIISHGGHGMVGETLNAGKPLLILPQQLEQSLLAHRVEVLGAGKSLSPQDVENEVEGLIKRLLDEEEYAYAAKKFQTEYSAQIKERPDAQIIRSIVGL